jgi:hypothetical protein
MKKFFVLSSFFIVQMFFSQDVASYRKMIQKSEQSEKDALVFLEKSKTEYDKTKKPIVLSFYAASQFFMAKHSGNLIKKYSYFNRGKKLLDQAVSLDPDNLEIRFLRLLCQDKTPRVLGYTQYLDEDKAFVVREYKKSKDQELVQQIQKYLNNKM